jgi:hypothetical protein
MQELLQLCRYKYYFYIWYHTTGCRSKKQVFYFWCTVRVLSIYYKLKALETGILYRPVIL